MKLPIAKWKIIMIAGFVPIALIASLPYLYSLDYQARFREMDRILDNVSEEELVNRTKDMPQVVSFMSRHNHTDTYLDLDYHIGVVYSSSTKCSNEFRCGDQIFYEECEIMIDLKTGFPAKDQTRCPESQPYYPQANVTYSD